MLPHTTESLRGPALLACAALVVVGLASAPAGAQQSCGDSYTIRSGDTLSAVASRCGVPLNDLLGANPGIEPRRLSVGQTIALPGTEQAGPVADAPAAEAPRQPSPAEAADPPAGTDQPAPTAEWGTLTPEGAQRDDALPAAPPGANYTVQTADSLVSIAKQFNTTVTDLVLANPQLNMQRELLVGQRLVVPGLDQEAAPRAQVNGRKMEPWPDDRFTPGAAVEVLPRRVMMGDSVTVYARGFPSRVPVEVAAGRPGGELTVVAQENTDHFGTMRARIVLPKNTDPDEPLVVVVGTPDRTHGARSAQIAVRPQGTLDDARPGERVEVIGTLTDEGRQCPALRDDSGRLYTLSGNVRGYGPGDTVRVVGLVAGTSQCNQGVTLSAARIEKAPANQAER